MTKKLGKKAKSAKQIVEEAMPNARVVNEASRAPAPGTSDASQCCKPGASMAALRAKYQGRSCDAAEAACEDSAAAKAAKDVEVFQVRSKQSPVDPADDPGPRTVIVSKSKGILGSQG